MENENNFHKCGNCDTEYNGNFCPECGQSRADISRPFSVLLIDLMGNIYAFDTRLLKTLKSLLFRPGQMALDYIAGKRVRYMPPVRMYIFISLIFFLLLGYSTNRGIRADKISGNSSAVVIDGDLKIDGVKDENLSKKFKDIKENPSAYITKFYNYLSWSLFILMPFFALLTWMIFHKSRPQYLAHLIFSLCEHSFIFIIFIILILSELIFPHKKANPEAFLLLLVPVYVTAGMRKLTGKKWTPLILKLTAVWILYLIAVMAIVVSIALLLFTSASF